MKIVNPYEALLKISEDINSLKDTAFLLDKVMDIALNTLKAERGFIILKSHKSDTDFDMVTARNMSQEAVSSIRELSSSVVNKVIEEDVIVPVRVQVPDTDSVILLVGEDDVGLCVEGTLLVEEHATAVSARPMGTCEG